MGLGRQEDNNFMKMGLVGIGYWGKNLLRVLNSLGNVQVKYACDENDKLLGEAESKYPRIKFVQDYRRVINDPEINAIAIATPAATHYALVKEALEANKDVFVEKPLAINSRDGQELLELALRNNKILMVGHILQYHPAVIKLKEIIAKGELGKVQYIYSNRLNIGKLRTEENILWSFAPHDISVILMLLEEEPVKVLCFGGDYLNKGVYDTTVTVLEFKNSVKGHIFVSWLHPFKEQKLVVVGSEAMAVFDDLSAEKLLVYPHKIEWVEGKIPVAHKAQYQTLAIEKREPLEEELKHFIECVASRKTPRTDAKEALRVLKVLEVAEKSLKACLPAGREN